MARISELNYSNAYAKSSGIDEFLEVALEPGQDPADFQVAFYQHTGEVGKVISLDDPGVTTTVDAQTGETVLQISSDVFNTFLTDPDGGGSNNYEAFALVDQTAGETIDFYDIGGGTKNIEAKDGPAAGEVSENIPTPTNANKADYSIQFNKEDGGEVSYNAISEGDSGFVCFCEGSVIATPDGPKRVETLVRGDKVTTKDHGAQPLLWVGQETVVATQNKAPVQFAACAGHAPLRVSQQHRILVSHPALALTHDTHEGFVAARHMVDGKSVRLAPHTTTTYVHLAFARHEIVSANGRWCESLFVGPETLRRLPPILRAEVLAALKTRHLETARPVISAREWAALSDLAVA